MKKEERSILYGLAIGDGHISYRHRLQSKKYPYIEAALMIGHGPKQKEYIEYKREIITSILGGSINIGIRKYHIGDKTHIGYAISKTNPYFKQMHSTLYKEGRKIISKEILSFLDVRSLALWYMDDGSINFNRNKQGEITSLNFELHTQCIEEQEAIGIKDWLLKEFNIDTKVCNHKGKYNIRGATQSTLSLCRLVEPYIIPCMMYKIAPAFRFVFRKSAKHPHFEVDDIVQPT